MNERVRQRVIREMVRWSCSEGVVLERSRGTAAQSSRAKFDWAELLGFGLAAKHACMDATNEIDSMGECEDYRLDEKSFSIEHQQWQAYCNTQSGRDGGWFSAKQLWCG